MTTLALVAAIVFGYGLVSRRLQNWAVTGPMIMTAAGVLLGEAGLGVLDLHLDDEGIRLLAEVTLVLVLFVDAVAIRVPALRMDLRVPVRMLGIGLPLVVTLGGGVALLLLPELGLVLALLLGALLAPTDAALGQVVVTAEQVPLRLRQSLSVESGLNDGIALPVVTVLLGVAVGEVEGLSPGGIAVELVRVLGLGVAVGAGVGCVGGWLVDRATAADWITPILRQLASLALAVGAFAAAEAVGGNGFVAAFVAGLGFGVVARDRCPEISDFAEDEGTLLSLLTFLVFGATLLGDVVDQLTPRVALYALASLLLVRAVGVGASLLGSGLDRAGVAFLAWFGPRGLASVLFTILVLEEGAVPPQGLLVTTVAWTVGLSVVLHGVSAHLVVARYAR